MYKYQGQIKGFGDELRTIFKAVTTGSVGDQYPELEGMPRLAMFTASRVRYLDHDGVRYIEQNPNSNSQYGRRARAGAKIMWVIRLRDNAWLGYVEDGKVYTK